MDQLVADVLTVPFRQIASFGLALFVAGFGAIRRVEIVEPVIFVSFFARDKTLVISSHPCFSMYCFLHSYDM